MKRKSVLILFPLLTLLTAFPMPARSAEPLTAEQIVSVIDSGMWYQGSDVRAALFQVIQIGQQEIKQTAEEAVKAAVVPLEAEISRQKAEKEFWQVAGITAGAGLALDIVIRLVSWIASLIK